MTARVPQTISGEGLSEILGQEDAATSDYPPGWFLGLIPSYHLFLHLHIELLSDVPGKWQCPRYFEVQQEIKQIPILVDRREESHNKQYMRCVRWNYCLRENYNERG